MSVRMETVAIVLETKDEILDYIKLHPGSHLRQIKRELGLSMGVAQYHLYALEKEKRILSRRKNLYRRFYPAFGFSEHQQQVLDVLSQETERDLVIYLVQNPSANQKELSEYAKISAGTVNWHMKRLIASGLVKVRREGQFVKYTVKCDKEEILKLVKVYHPSTWASWADRLANALSEMSPEAVNDKSKEEKNEWNDSLVKREK